MSTLNIEFKKLLSAKDSTVVDLYAKYRPVTYQEVKQKTCSFKLLIWKDKNGEHSIDFTKDSSFYLTCPIPNILTILQRGMQKLTNFSEEQCFVFKVIMTIDGVDYCIEKREQVIKVVTGTSQTTVQPETNADKTSYKVKTQMCLSQFSSSLNINTGVTTTAWKTISSSPAAIYSFVRANVGKLTNSFMYADTSFITMTPKHRLDMIFEWLAVDTIADIYDKKVYTIIVGDINKLKIELYKLPVPTMEPVNIQSVLDSQRLINENLTSLQVRQQAIEKHIADIRQAQLSMTTFENLQKKINLLDGILSEQSEFLYKQNMKDYTHVFSASQVDVTPEEEQFFSTWESKLISADIITQAKINVELLSAELKINPKQTDLSSRLQTATQELELLNDIQANRAKLKQRQKYLDYLETVKEERLKGEIIRLKSQIETITLIQKDFNCQAISFKSEDAQDNKIVQSAAGIQKLLTSINLSSNNMPSSSGAANSTLISNVILGLAAHLKLCVLQESDIKQDIEDNYGKLGKLNHLCVKYKKHQADKQEYDTQVNAKKKEISSLELLLSHIKKRQLAIEFLKEHINFINVGLAEQIKKYNLDNLSAQLQSQLPLVSLGFVGEGIKILSGPLLTEQQQQIISQIIRALINARSAHSFKLMFLFGETSLDLNFMPGLKICNIRMFGVQANSQTDKFPTADCKGPQTIYCIENPAEQLLNRHIEERKQAKAKILEQKKIKSTEEKKILSDIKETETTAKLIEQENKNTLLADDKEKTLQEREKIRKAMEDEQKDNPIIFGAKQEKKAQNNKTTKAKKTKKS